MTAKDAKPIEDLTDRELAWAAGLFEGEGTITIAIRNLDETYRLLVTLGNTDRQVVEFFHDRWGGWLQPVYGERPGRQPAWTWTVTAGRAETFLRKLRPHVVTDRVKRKLAIALAFRKHQSSLPHDWRDPAYKPHQRSLYLEMRELNRRGVQKEPA